MLAEDRLEMVRSDNQTQASLFIGLGSPMLAMEFDEFNETLTGFTSKLPVPSAIVVMSPNWITDNSIHITAESYPEQIFDIKGFPESLKQLTYPCIGEPALAEQISLILEEAGIKTELVEERGIDSGVWVPLYTTYPDASVPVIQLSVPKQFDSHKMIKIGQILSQFRKKGVLLVGTGNIVYDKESSDFENKYQEPDTWAKETINWFTNNLREMNIDELSNYAKNAPHSEKAITKNRILPLFFTLGTMQQKDFLTEVFSGFYYGNISMDSFAMVRNY